MNALAKPRFGLNSYRCFAAYHRAEALTATTPFQSHEAKPLDPIPNDHESGPEKWMSIFGISHEFNRSLPEGFSRSGLRSLLRLKVAVEIYHQPGGAGRVDLPLARDCGSGAGDE